MMRRGFPLLLGMGAILWLMVATAYPVTITPKAREQLLRSAQDMIKAGRPGSALEQLEYVYGELPEDAVVVRTLFDLLVHVKKYERAEEVMKAYLEVKPTDVRSMRDLAVLMFKMERPDEALPELERIIATAPGESWPYEIVLEALMTGGMDGRALEHIARARDALGDLSLIHI